MSFRNQARGKWGLKKNLQLRRADLGLALLCTLFVALALHGAVTQWFAHRLAYRPVLGTPWVSLGREGIYAPWSWLSWRATIAAHYPTSGIVRNTDGAAELIALVSLAAFAYFLVKLRAKRENRIDELHGSAHFAVPEEVGRTHLLGRSRGVFLAHWIEPKTWFLGSPRLRYLRHHGATHSMVSGPPRIGKDAGNLVTTLLDAHPDQSVLVHDPKGDAWKLTSGYRASQGHRVIRFAPSLEPHLTARLNALINIRLRTFNEVADAQLLAASFLNGDGLGFKGNNAIFAFAARPLLTACFLHVLYRAERLGQPTAGLPHVFNEFMNPQLTYDQVLTEWLTFEHDPDYSRGWTNPDGTPTKTHPMVASCAREQLFTDDKKLRQNVKFCITSALELLYDDCLRSNLSSSDFSPHDLVNGDQPTSLYLVYPHPHQERLAPIFRMLVEQLFQRLTEEMQLHNGKPVRPHKYKLHCLFNEFGGLGRMDAVQKALPVCPSFGIQVTVFVQDPVMIRELYGEKETLSPQFGVRVYYPPNSLETAEEISKLLGKATATSQTPRRTGQSDAAEHETGRPLLSADEVMRIPGPDKEIDERGEERIVAPGDVLVFKTGCAPIYGQQILYWEDPVLLARAQIPSAAGCPRVTPPPRPALSAPSSSPPQPVSQPIAAPAPAEIPASAAARTEPPVSKEAADVVAQTEEAALDDELAALDELSEAEPA